MNNTRGVAGNDLVGSDLRLLDDFLLTMWFERPTPGPEFHDIYCRNKDFPLALDAPFGSSGPMVLDLGVLRVLLSDWSSIQSVMSIEKPARLVLDYTKVMMAGLLFHPAPRQIEIIGLGGGSIVKFCHRHMSDCAVTVVEIDPQVLTLRKRFAIPEDDDRLRTVLADGYDFIVSDSGHPDILIVDGFNRFGCPGRLASRTFYDRCRERLGDTGVLVVNLGDGYFRSSRPLANLRRCFGGQVFQAPDITRHNRIAFASRMSDFLPSAETLSFPAESNRYPWLDLSALADRIVAAAKQRSTRRSPRPFEPRIDGDKRVAMPPL